MLLPDFTVVGSPRCGTTTLYESLLEHPQIYMRREVKELNYFCTQWIANPGIFSKHLDLAKEAYYRCLGEPNLQPGVLVGDISPWYCTLPNIAQLLQLFNPNCKVILILRDPVERFYSNFYYLKDRYRPEMDLDDFIRRSITDIQNGNLDLDPFSPSALIYQSMYNCIYDNLTRYLDPAQICLLFFDDMQYNFSAYIEKVCRFLGITPIYDATTIKANSCKAFKKEQQTYDTRLIEALQAHTRWYHALQEQLGMSSLTS